LSYLLVIFIEPVFAWKVKRAPAMPEDDKALPIPVEYSGMQGVRNNAVKVVQVLREAGFCAYWAGGCVRDLVMNLEPEDFDIATDARPEDVMRLFRKTVPVGLSFGVVRVLYEDAEFEVATFRADGRYLDGRHPAEVRFAGEKEDALRRDFTINGMFYDPLRKEVIDYVRGREDIRARVIRTIGRPEDRFGEDHLRLMRGVRFAARFQYTIEPKTEEAIKKYASTIRDVSAERIRDELEKMLTGPHPSDSLRFLYRDGLLQEILPEVVAMDGVEQPPEYHPEGDVLTHTLLMLDLMTRPVEESPPLSFELALSVLLHDIGKPLTFVRRERIRFDNHCEVGARMARRIGHRLRLSNDQQDTVFELVRDHLKFKDVRQMRESTLKRFLRQPRFEDHLELHRLDCLSSHKDLSHWEFCRDKLRTLPPEAIRPPRLLTGEDLIQMGLKPGPVFKEILGQVEDAQLEGRMQTREEALAFVEERFFRK
jgi:poly(A) polymerase